MTKRSFNMRKHWFNVTKRGFNVHLTVMWQMPSPAWACASSCAGPNGPTWRRPSRKPGTWRAWRPCACGSGASARPSARTSIGIPASDSGRVSLLWEKKKKKLYFDVIKSMLLNTENSYYRKYRIVIYRNSYLRDTENSYFSNRHWHSGQWQR